MGLANTTATGKASKNFPESMGKHGKGEMNSNGKEIPQFYSRPIFVLTRYSDIRWLTEQFGKALL